MAGPQVPQTTDLHWSRPHDVGRVEGDGVSVSCPRTSSFAAREEDDLRPARCHEQLTGRARPT